ncbi:MAG: VanW family protein [Chloroflexi bacterium]|nr:VanW family protein [Chloroflexota bacterium]
MTTTTFPNRLIRPVATPPARRAIVIGFGATLLAALLIASAVSTGVGVAAGSSALPGVTVGGVAVGGLSRQEVADRLAEQLPSLSAGNATLAIGDETVPVSFEELGRGYQVDTMVDAAMALGRGSNPLADGVARLRSLVHVSSVPVAVHAYDPDALARISTDIAQRISVPAVEASVVADGATFTVSPGATGLHLEAGAVEAAVAGAVSTTSPADVHITLEPTVVDPAVSTETAEAVAASARSATAPLTFEIPGAAADEAPITLAPETIASWLSFGPDYGGVAYALHVDEAAAQAALAGMAETVDRDAVNARIAVAAAGGLGGVIPGQEGRSLNVEASHDALMRILSRRAAGAPIASLGLAVDVTEPAVTTAAAEAILPRMQMVSSWTTYYVPGDGNGYGNNINIGARDIDGRNLAPGEWFSFWGSIGPVTVERGYHYGGVIIGGRSVAGGAIGGGICSTSTTIFNAALRAGLEMGDRANHYYYIDRYPDGLDATVYMADDWVQDMTFRNDTEHPIVIRGFGGNGFVTFQLWTVPTGRTVVLTDPATSNHRKAIDTTQVVAGMAPGTSKRVEYPHDGHDVSRTRYVYDANGTEIHRNTYFSSYRTVNGIVQTGPAPAPEPPEPPGDTADAGAETPAP